MNQELTKVEFTNLKKILFPKLKITKSEVIEYYIRIAPRMLHFLEDRPLVITRFPNGISQKGFYEKNAPQGTPSWVRTFKVYSKTAKRTINHVLCNDLDTLIWLANLAAIEIHVPFSKVNSREKPDLIFFDVDPEPPATSKDAQIVALLLKEKLDKLGLKAFAKTSGKKGFHVLIPIVREHTYKETRMFVHRIGRELAKEYELVVSEFKETKKPGKVFIDYLQNSLGRTMICPYSLRATPGATISTPLEWAEIKKGIKPAEFNIRSVLKREKDPWKRVLDNKQRSMV